MDYVKLLPLSSSTSVDQQPPSEGGPRVAATQQIRRRSRDEAEETEGKLGFADYHLPAQGLPGGSEDKVSACQFQSLGWEDPLEKEIATHSSILVWGIPWTEDSGGLWSMGLQRVRHD